MKLGKFLTKFIILLFLAIIISCSGGSSTQSVEDVGDDTPGDNFFRRSEFMVLECR